MATTKYIINQSIIPLVEGNNYLYFANNYYIGTLDVVCNFTNQNSLYNGFVFSNSSLSTAGLTEVYNGSWINENYRTIYVEDKVPPFILPNAERPLTCFIFKNLTNCSLTNPSTTIREGYPYTSGVSTEMLSTPVVSILMGGVDITSTAWDLSTKTITINSVTGNLNISIAYSGLPTDYIELEYIESTGTQAINAECYPNNNYKVFVDILYTNPTFGYGPIFKAKQTGSTTPYFGIGTNNNDTTTRTMYGNEAENNEFNQYLRHTVCLDKNRVYINNNLVREYSTTTFVIDQKGHLFAEHNGTNYIYYAKVKLYSCKIYENDIFVRNFIPVRKLSTGEVGLYDYITDTFFGNQGTGEFIAGPVKGLPDAYQEVEYIKCSGAQYINTGLSVNYNYKLIMSIYKDTDVAEYQQIFGIRGYGAQLGLYIRRQGTDTNVMYDYVNRSASKTYSTVFPIQQTHNIVIDKNNVYVNGSLQFTTAEQTFGYTTAPLFLMAFNAADGSRDYCYCRFLRCAMWDNNDLVRNFIPCYRKSDSKPGLYDLANNQFYVNQGTGADFTVGPDVL